MEGRSGTFSVSYVDPLVVSQWSNSYNFMYGPSSPFIGMGQSLGCKKLKDTCSRIGLFHFFSFSELIRSSGVVRKSVFSGLLEKILSKSGMKGHTFQNRNV